VFRTKRSPYQAGSDVPQIPTRERPL
jgi:hypothetical protein